MKALFENLTAKWGKPVIILSIIIVILVVSLIIAIAV